VRCATFGTAGSGPELPTNVPTIIYFSSFFRHLILCFSPIMADTKGIGTKREEAMPKPLNIEKARKRNALYANSPDEPRSRIISEDEASWRQNLSLDAFRIKQRRTGRPARIQLSDGRHGYRLSEVLQP
jgi:hypothetical protein